MKEYGAVVIGSGSGLDIANAAASRGLEVAIVEKGPLGGTCLNRGCIPSKMLIHRADLAEQISNSERFRIHANMEGIDFKSMVKEVSEEVGSEARQIERGIRNFDRFTLYKDEAKFVDKRTLEVGGEKVKGEKVIVAAGARPFIPPLEGLEGVDYLTSREALKLRERPKHLVIVGGGYVAAELGHFFGSLGSEVGIIAAHNNLIHREDRDIYRKFTEIFQDKYGVKTGFRATEVWEDNGKIYVKAESGSGEQIEVSGDELLMATGRKPNTDLLEVEKAGIETDDKGFVKTNEYLETTAENVWALGDIVNSPMFKHTANWEAEYVYLNVFTDHKHPVDYSAMPHAIFSSPQIAGVGKTEQELEEESRDYLKSLYEYKDTGMGSALKEKEGFVKALASPGGKIQGCHILGPHASILIHEVVVAMRSGEGTVDNVTKSVHVHPALSEVVQRAFNTLH